MQRGCRKGRARQRSKVRGSAREGLNEFHWGF